jgi:hypothetical protein
VKAAHAVAIAVVSAAGAILNTTNVKRDVAISFLRRRPFCSRKQASISATLSARGSVLRIEQSFKQLNLPFVSA